MATILGKLTNLANASYLEITSMDPYVFFNFNSPLNSSVKKTDDVTTTSRSAD